MAEESGDTVPPTQAQAQPPPPDPTVRERIGDEVRAAGELGREALMGPDGVLDQLREALLGWFRRIWKLRGGGLYAVGFALSLLYLEVMELLFDDIPTFLSLDSYDAGAVISFGVEVLIDTIRNTVLAFTWPVVFVQWQPPLGIILLVLAFLLFPKYVKPHLERWLFDDESK